MKHQRHLFPIISLALVAGLIALLATVQLTFSAVTITIICLLYLVSNVIYGLHEKSLTVIRVLELGLVTIVIEFTALTYFT